MIANAIIASNECPYRLKGVCVVAAYFVVVGSQISWSRYYVGLVGRHGVGTTVPSGES